MNLQGSFVLDASALIPAFTNDARKPQSQAVLEAIIEGEEGAALVPSLFYSEVASAFWQVFRFVAPDAEKAWANLREVRLLPLTVHPLENILDDAFDMALRLGTSVYDGCYAAIAKQFDVPLVSADTKLLALVSGHIKTISLTDLNPT